MSEVRLRFRELRPATLALKVITDLLYGKARSAGLRMAESVRGIALVSMKQAKQGTTKRGTKFIIPSDPGEPPRRRKGTLASSIAIAWDPTRRAAVVGPTIEYGAFLEFGSGKLSPRPFMRPAFDKAMALRALTQAWKQA